VETAENLAILLGMAGPNEGHLDFSAKQGDGRTQLMRSVAGEGADAGKGLIDAFEHLVEGVGKVGDFVFFPGDGQTGFEIAFVDAARLGCQSCHGAKRLAAQ